MTGFLVIVFFISVFGLVHSYLLYPFGLKLLARNKQNNQITFDKNSQNLPRVSAIISIYNEEKVIEQKLLSLLQSDYPKDKLEIFVGSDCSSDRSNAIVSKMAKEHDCLHFFAYKERSGKPGVLNKLAQIIFSQFPQSENHILLLTDANVILEKNTLYELVKHFKNKKIAIVDANMINVGMKSEGISKSENQYIKSEVLLKQNESLVKQKMIGPFGGCYTLRSTYFNEVPKNYLVDDFFIAMKVLQQKALVINELDAFCYEAVSHDIMEEYKRKTRISAGNFQNLNHFKSVFWPPNTTLAFRFFSHKVLRWLGPFLMITAFVTSGLLSLIGIAFFQFIFLVQLLVYIAIPILNFLLNKVNVNNLLLKNVSYFLFMNLALLVGFFNYLKGVKKNTWEPPKRL